MKFTAFEMPYYIKILTVCWKDRDTKRSIRDRVKHHHTTVDLIMQRKLKLFEHICRMEEKRL